MLFLFSVFAKVEISWLVFNFCAAFVKSICQPSCCFMLHQINIYIYIHVYIDIYINYRVYFAGQSQGWFTLVMELEVEL